jgi:hypothetical protein
MSRKPVHLELKGGKGPRQRIWEAICALEGQPFSTTDVLPAGAHRTTAEIYLRSLALAGYIEQGDAASSEVTNRPRQMWRLVRHAGLDAPRLDREGNAVTQGRGNEAMWQMIRHFLPEFDHRELAAHASSQEHPISQESARRYADALHQAGYLIVAKEPTRHRPRRYRLDPARNTGPKSPMIQRTSAVYDQNLNQIVWLQEPDWEAV